MLMRSGQLTFSLTALVSSFYFVFSRLVFHVIGMVVLGEMH